MPYTKTLWVDRSVEKPLTYNIIDNPDGTKTLVPAEGTVITAGTPITAANMNAHEDGIFNAVATAEEAVALSLDYKMIATDVDSDGIYTTIEYIRADDSVYLTSVLGSPDAEGRYQTITITKGAVATVFQLTYDDNGVITAIEEVTGV